MEFKTIRRANFIAGTRAIVRADCDVSLERGAVKGPFRINAIIPLLAVLIKKRIRIRVIAHRGRPHGKRASTSSLKPVALLLQKLLQRKIIFVNDPFDPANFVRYADAPEILFFENIRFWPGEEKNSSTFSKVLSRWGDIYINEAFAASHRPHASIAGLPRILPAYAGMRLEEEISFLSRVLHHPSRPCVAIFGGEKFETKLPLIRKFSRIADAILVGGALANSFLKAQGFETGKSVADNIAARDVLYDKKIILPSDAIVVSSLRQKRYKVKSIYDIAKEDFVADIGPESTARFLAALSGARTVIWNGPLGYAEIPRFAAGTKSVAKSLAAQRSFRVVGGGDTVQALETFGLRDRFTHVSTGGGAMLEFLSGKKLPGIEALKRQIRNSKFKTRNNI